MSWSASVWKPPPISDWWWEEVTYIYLVVEKGTVLVLKAFKNWLFGKEKPPTPDEALTNLKVQRRKLGRIEEDWKNKRKKALKEVRKTVRNEEERMAMNYAKEAIGYTRQLSSLVELKVKINQLIGLLERSTTINKVSQTIKNISPALDYIDQEVSRQEVKDALKNIVRKGEKIQLQTEQLMGLIDSMMIEGTDVEKAAKQLVEEISIEEGVKKEPTLESEKIDDEEVSKLLKEVKDEMNRGF